MGISHYLRIVDGRFDIPHSDLDHSMNIVNKDGIEAWENKLSVICASICGRDVNVDQRFTKIDDVKARAAESIKTIQWHWTVF